jgi:hypothetical protein
MQNSKYFLYAVFIFLVFQSALSPAETKFKNEASKIQADSISKSEIADFRKSFEAAEKTIATRRGSYEDAQRQLNSLRGSRVRNLPEFAGRFSAMQQKLSDWNKEVNPKQPPVVTPSTPTTTPKNNTGKQPQAEVKDTAHVEIKSSMLSYFPDTISVGNDFIAYVEISRNNSVQMSGTNANSTVDEIVTGITGMKTGAVNSMLSADLRIDGGNENFTISPRFDSKSKTVDESSNARWEWLIRPNAAGDFRLRLTVNAQRQGADGITREVPAITKVFVVKGLAKKTDNAGSSTLLWVIIGVVVLLLVILAIVLSRGRRNNNRHKDRDNNRRDTEVHRNIKM